MKIWTLYALLLLSNSLIYPADTITRKNPRVKKEDLCFAPNASTPFAVINQHQHTLPTSLTVRIFPQTKSILLIYRISTDAQLLKDTAKKLEETLPSHTTERSCANELMVKELLEQIPQEEDTNPSEYLFLAYATQAHPEYVTAHVTTPSSNILENTVFKYAQKEELVMFHKGALKMGTPKTPVVQQNDTKHRLETLALQALASDASASLFMFDHLPAQQYINVKIKQLKEKIKAHKKAQEGL